MKKDKFLKTFAVLGAVSVLGASGLAACAPKTTEPNPVNPNPPVVDPIDPTKPVDPEKPDPKPPVDPEEEAKKLFDEKVATAKAYFDAIDRNVTIDFTQSGNGVSIDRTYVFDDTKAMVEDGGDIQYFEYIDGKGYVYQNDGETWVKDYYEEDAFKAIGDLTDYANVTWDSYDKDAKQLVSGAGKLKTTLTIENGVATVVYIEGQLTTNIIFKDATTSVVAVPENVVDNTKPPVVEDKIYEIVNGQKVVNVPVFASAVEEFFAQNPNYYKTIMGRNYTLKQVLFVTNNNDEISLGFCSTYDNNLIYQEMEISKDCVADVLSEMCDTKEKFKKYIQNNFDAGIKAVIMPKGSPVIYECDTLTGTTEQKAQFASMTQNINTKLGINMDEIYFACKTAKGTQTAAGDRGYVVAWDHFYLAKIDGQIKLIKIQVDASTNRGSMNEIANVVDNTEYWGCSLQDEKVLNADNAKLYEQTQTKNVEKSMEL